MASSYRTLDTDMIKVRTIVIANTNNVFVPSSFILISDGNGGTHWSSISTILPISSFRTIKGNTAATFSADMSYNLLQVSTTGVRGTFESYVDPVTSTLMLSNAFPPIGVNRGSVSIVNSAYAYNLPNPSYMSPVNGNSTIKFLGVGDIQLSTVEAYKATFISISTFTSAGYSTISGETFRLRPAIASTFSTARGLASFRSSINYTNNTSYWSTGTGFMTIVGKDAYITSLGFDAASFKGYIDATESTKIFLDFTPTFVFPCTTVGSNVNPNLLRSICTFLISSDGIPFPETVTQHYIHINNSNANSSNLFQTPIYLNISTGSFNAKYATPYPLYLRHRIDNAVYDGGTNPGFFSTGNTVAYDNRTCVTTNNSAYISMFNTGPLFT
jgi:hypothetical protein